MLRTLLAKDLTRARRNPVPWLISLFIPFLLTAMLGAVFGRKGGGDLGTIHVALVDEDNSGLGEFLKGALEQMRTADSDQKPPFDLAVETLGRDEAVRRTTAGDFSAVVVLPAGFSDGFFESGRRVSLELIKNPAQAIQPRVIEESMALLTAALSAIKDLGGPQLDELRDLIESDDDALTQLAVLGTILVSARDRLEPVRDYLTPPLVSYREETRADTAAKSPGWNMFAYLLAGMCGMFLLNLTDHAMRDVYRELRLRTLERFQTLHEGLLAFIASKVLYAVVIGALGGAIMLWGGSLVFRFSWSHPGPLAVLLVAYAFCGAGLLGVLAAIAGTERRADALGSITIMVVAMLGGCMFPPNIFPPFLRENVTPFMPPGWFASAARALQDGDPSSPWTIAAVKCLVTGAVAVLLTAALTRLRIQKGVRA